MRPLMILMLVSFVTMLSAGGAVQPETVVLEFVNGFDDYEGARDTTIYSDSANSNGKGQNVFSGETNRGAERRALIAYDLSAIPQGVTIVAVTLELTVSRTQDENTRISVHRLTKDWGEGEEDAGGREGRGASALANSATWRSNFHEASDWEQPGGDFMAETSASATARGVNAKVRFQGDGMLADVQGWVDGEAEIFGWILIGRGTAKRFHSSDSGAEERRPKLVVEFQP